MRRIPPLRFPRLVLLSATAFLAAASLAAEPSAGPYPRQVAENIEKLTSAAPADRAAGAEALGLLRAYDAEAPLRAALADGSPQVRRQAAMALAWCGNRSSVPALLASLDDDDGVVRQSAWVSLTNLTGMELPAPAPLGSSRPAGDDPARTWRAWWSTVPSDRPPPEVLALLRGPRNLASGRAVTASAAYKGPPEVLTDGRIGPEYWQTKFVKPPQWATVDLGRPREVARVVVHQYGPAFAMTEYELASSLDGKTFTPVRRHRGPTAVDLAVDFPPRQARHLRVTSFGSANPAYPTTWFEIEAFGPDQAPAPREPAEWRMERGLRALGSLGGRGAGDAVLEVLGDRPPAGPVYRPMVRAGLRALGRLREEAGFRALIGYLDAPLWARYAADALGDRGDRRAVLPLVAAYARYARTIAGADPRDVPADDRMGFPSEDRMLETPYWIAYALCRLPLDGPHEQEALRQIAPQVMANLPGDHDTFFLYQPEVGHLLTRHLMDRSGLRREAVEHAMGLLGQASRPARRKWPAFPPRQMATWLPALCAEADDLPRLVALLEHKDYWVRLNAAKALAWLGDRRAVGPIARLLAEAKAEADFGSTGKFKDEEFDDPCPRWREGLIRALGLLGAHDQTDRIIAVLNDPGSVLEVRHAAAEALADLGGAKALEALRTAALEHSFLSVRHVARDAVRRRGPDPAETGGRRPSQPSAGLEDSGRAAIRGAAGATMDALVFIKGNNVLENNLHTVEQADRWRQTYVVSDEGPSYRPGSNLYVLSPPRPDGRVAPLTRFDEGYVGEPELSWDARQVLFTRRGKKDPWWHVWRVNLDGSGLIQLSAGPYHAVGPAWLPDGRIVFASSRVGIRDEYHGYPCTALWVMNADGSDPHPIATNIGRDNEPVVLPDGRIAFSRLEVFYSRNKTELTLHAVHPDGTKDVVLYGPERRAFWRDLDHGPPDPADGQESPLTHRVLRMTQPQPVPGGRGILVSTQGGLTLLGPCRDRETLVCPDYRQRAYTTPFPLPDGRVLCGSTLKTPDLKKIDLGLYLFDPRSGGLELVYNDPATADYEPRPVLRRAPPMLLAAEAKRGAYSGQFVCASVYTTQEEEVRRRGRLVRLVEGVPVVARHSTHNAPTPVWQNHGGTLARVLGTAPVAPDGSFSILAPADRLLHFQVLDSDGRAVGNQLTWIYPRPGEIKSCVGCHERPHSAPPARRPLATFDPPLDFLPDGREFSYRAKAWFKGWLPPEVEERTRTVHAVNLLAR